MSNPITKQQLIDATTDAQTLSDVMNSTADSVTTRLGTTVPTMKKALQLATGPAGPQGLEGPQGPRGPAGPAGGSPEAALPINILDFTAIVSTGAVKTDGTIDSSFSGFWLTPMMNLRGATQWCANFPLSMFAPTFGVAYYNAGGAFLSGFAGPSNPSAPAAVFNVPAGAVFVQAFFKDNDWQTIGLSGHNQLMILAGPTVPSAYQSFDPDSQYGAAGVMAGQQLSLAFYKSAGALITSTAITSDTTGVHLNVPGTHTAGKVVQSASVVHPSGLLGNGASHSFVQEQRDTTILGTGYSLGNAGGWSTGFSDTSTLNVAVRGIHQNKGFTIQKHAVGDTAGIYGYVRSDGGASAASDEGVSGATIEVSENDGYFHGTVASTTGAKDRAPVLAFTSGNPWTTDGAYLLNISKGTITGRITGPGGLSSLVGASSTQTLDYIKFLTVSDVTLPISTAAGIVRGVIPNNGTTADSPVPTTLTVDLIKVGGVLQPFTVGEHVSVAGAEYPEQSFISAAGAVAGDGSQSITLPLRNPNYAAVIFQGGVAGQFISFDANIPFNAMRTSYFAFGSLNGTDLIYGLQSVGGLVNGSLPQTGSEPATADGGTNSHFHLYPGAEIVRNNSMGFDCTLEQNNVAWAPGDVVENPHFMTPASGAATFTVYRVSPTFEGYRSAALTVSMSGQGTGGPGTSGLFIQNAAPATNFTARGGPVLAPTLISADGSFGHTIFQTTAPQTGSAIIRVQGPSDTNALAPVKIFDINYAGGGNLWFNPANATWSTDGNLQAVGLATTGTIKAGGGVLIESNGSLQAAPSSNIVVFAQNATYDGADHYIDPTKPCSRMLLVGDEVLFQVSAASTGNSAPAWVSVFSIDNAGNVKAKGTITPSTTVS